MTIQETIYQIQHLLAKSQISDDHGWSDRWIYHELLKYRSRLVSQKFKQREPISQELIQETPCLNLIEVSDSDCPCDDPDSCFVYRTELALPNSIIPYISVQNTTGSVEYLPQSFSTARFRSNTRFKKLNKKSFYYSRKREEGTYLYIVSNNPLPDFKIIVRGIWEDPTIIQKFPNCSGEISNVCKSHYELDFIISDSLFATVKEMILQAYVRIKVAMPDSIVNNNNEGNQPNGRQPDVPRE